MVQSFTVSLYNHLESKLLLLYIGLKVNYIFVSNYNQHNRSIIDVLTIINIKKHKKTNYLS